MQLAPSTAAKPRVASTHKGNVKDTLRKLAELTLTHVATFAFPLAFAVLCGRELGVHDFGIVSFYTALAAFLGVVIEFGFDWLGIREVSQATHDRPYCHLMLYNVTAAKVLICGVTSFVAVLVLWWVRGGGQGILVAAMILHMFGFAMDVSWYLRALERTRLLLGITVVTRLAGVALLWAVMSGKGNMAAALWSYTFVSVANAVIGWCTVVGHGLASRVQLKWSVIRGLMQRSWAIVFGNLSAALLTNGGVALLGFTADPATVGAANLALRVKMAGQAALLPVKQMAYVRLAALAHSQRWQAVRVARIALGVLLAGGLVISLAAAWGAELIVHQVFKGDYPVAVGLIMLLGLSVPLNAAAELLGMQCLIAFGQERAYALVVALAACVFSGLLLFVLRGPLAYGWALLAAEASLTLMAGLRMRAVLARPTESAT
jgi:O-antigen/teichoic acid export membrane protein